MGKKWSNAPVYHVVAQVRFNPVLTLDQYIPAIQDGLRKEGFTDFQQNFVATLNLNFGGKPIPDQPVSAIAAPTAQYVFADEDRMSAFTIENVAMSFQTSHYDMFPGFLSSLMMGLGILHRNVGLSFVERMGIRFLDAVIPPASKDITSYLSPGARGLVGQLKKRELIHSISETRTRFENTELVSRAVVLNQGPKANVAYPPDFGTPTLKLMDKFTGIEGTYAVIDTDSSYVKREKFDLGFIEKTFTSLKHSLHESFDLMITDQARNMWE